MAHTGILPSREKPWRGPLAACRVAAFIFVAVCSAVVGWSCARAPASPRGDPSRDRQPREFTTQSGLAVKIIEYGPGITPGLRDRVQCHVKAWVQGREDAPFRNTYTSGQPAQFSLISQNSGVLEALLRMPAGSTWRITVPPRLGFGKAGRPPAVGPDATLVYHIELQAVVGVGLSWKETRLKGKVPAGWKETASGIRFKIEREGKGDTPTSANTVECHYEGWLDGKRDTPFDSSYAREAPTSFPVTGVISGWTESLLNMRPGEKRLVKIPWRLAYGERGAGEDIPARTDLNFVIEYRKNIK